LVSRKMHPATPQGKSSYISLWEQDKKRAGEGVQWGKPRDGKRDISTSKQPPQVRKNPQGKGD